MFCTYCTVLAPYKTIWPTVIEQMWFFCFLSYHVTIFRLILDVHFSSIQPCWFPSPRYISPASFQLLKLIYSAVVIACGWGKTNLVNTFDLPMGRVQVTGAACVWGSETVINVISQPLSSHSISQSSPHLLTTWPQITEPTLTVNDGSVKSSIIKHIIVLWLAISKRFAMQNM